MENFNYPWEQNPEPIATKLPQRPHLIFQIWEQSIFVGGDSDISRLMPMHYITLHYRFFNVA